MDEDIAVERAENYYEERIKKLEVELDKLRAADMSFRACQVMYEIWHGGPCSFRDVVKMACVALDKPFTERT